jgi:hypothetical protein
VRVLWTECEVGRRGAGVQFVAVSDAEEPAVELAEQRLPTRPPDTAQAVSASPWGAPGYAGNRALARAAAEVAAGRSSPRLSALIAQRVPSNRGRGTLASKRRLQRDSSDDADDPSSALANAASAVADAASNTASGVSDSVSDAVSAVGDAASNTAGDVSSAASSLGDAATAVASSAETAVSDSASTIADTASTAVSVVQDAASDATSVAGDAVSSVSDAVSSAASATSNAASSVANWATSDAAESAAEKGLVSGLESTANLITFGTYGLVSGLVGNYQAASAQYGPDHPVAEGTLAVLATVAYATGIGQISEAVTGEDLITGRELSTEERVARGAVGAITFGMWGVGGEGGGEGGGELGPDRAPDSEAPDTEPMSQAPDTEPMSQAPDTDPGSGAQTANSPVLDPAEFAGKTPAEIDQLARDNGLIPKGKDPSQGLGSYVDPVTGEQRVLSHPNDPDGAHMHVNNQSGQRLDINGDPVDRDGDPDCHLPIGTP